MSTTCHFRMSIFELGRIRGRPRTVKKTSKVPRTLYFDRHYCTFPTSPAHPPPPGIIAYSLANITAHQPNNLHLRPGRRHRALHIELPPPPPPLTTAWRLLRRSPGSFCVEALLYWLQIKRNKIHVPSLLLIVPEVAVATKRITT